MCWGCLAWARDWEVLLTAMLREGTGEGALRSVRGFCKPAPKGTGTQQAVCCGMR